MTAIAGGGGIANTADVASCALIALFCLLALLALLVGSTIVFVRLCRVLCRDDRIEVPATSAPRVGAPAVAVAAPPSTPGTGLGSADGRAAPDDRRIRLATWRYRQLILLGLEPVTAVGAALAGTNVSFVRSLVAAGCPLELALSIVA